MPRARFSPARRLAVAAAVCLSMAALARTGILRAAMRAMGGVDPAPIITATKADSFPAGFDVNANGKADPGDKIRYRFTVANSGTVNATGVQINDTIDAHTTLVGGSTVISPLSVAESYQSIGNMTLTSAALGIDCAANALRSVTCNDLGTGTVTGFGDTQAHANDTAANGTNTVTTTNGGTVLVNANGTFVYNPGAGFEGTDTFWYTFGNAAGGDPAEVSIAVGGANGMVWFVTSTGGAGTGTQASPFNSLAAFNTANTGTGSNPASGDTVFLLENATALTGPVTLLDGQLLIGQDATAAVPAIGGPALPLNPPSTGSAAGNAYPASNPTGDTARITSAGVGVTLASGNTIAGFTVGNSTTAISGTAAGALKVRQVVVDTNGQALVISTSATVTNDATFTGFTSVSSGGGANGVLLTGISGTLALGSGTLTGGSAGTFAVNGGDGTITYDGNVTQSLNTALVKVSAGHTGTLTFNSGTLTALNGTGLRFNDADGTYNFNGTTTLNGGGAGIDIRAGSSGTFTFGTGATVTTPSVSAFNMLASNATVTYSGSMSAGSAFLVDIDEHDSGTVTFQTGTLTATGASARGIRVRNSNGGTISFNSPTITITPTAGQRGVRLEGNSGGTIVFNPGGSGNGLDITTTGAIGLSADDAGTISVLGTGNTISTTNATAVDINGAEIAAAGATFDSTSGSGSTHAIRLKGLTGSGTLALGGGSISATVAAFLVGEECGCPTGGTAAISYAGNITTSGSAVNVEVAGRDDGAGSIVFSGVLNHDANAPGVIVAFNDGGSVAFTGASSVLKAGTQPAIAVGFNDVDVSVSFGGGGLQLEATSGFGITTVFGGALTITGTGNTISVGTGVAIDVEQTGIASTGLTFQSVSADGSGGDCSGAGTGCFGISLVDTGSDGGLTITGVGTTAGSGGTIQNEDGNGILLVETKGASLSNMKLLGNSISNGDDPAFCGLDADAGSNLTCNANLYLSFVDGLTLTNLEIAGSAQMGVNGYAVSALAASALYVHDNGDEDNEHGLLITDLTGTSSITDSTFQDNYSRQAYINNCDGTNVALTVDGSSFTRTSAPGSGSQHAFFLGGVEDAHIDVEVTDSTFSKAGGGDGFHVDLFGEATLGSSSDHSSISGSTFADNASHVFVGVHEDAVAFFDTIDNTNMTLAGTQSIGYVEDADSTALGAFTGTISGNHIGSTDPSSACSTSNCHGILVSKLGLGALNVHVTDNTIENVTGHGILSGADGSNGAGLSITGNTITNANATAQGPAILVGVGATDSPTLCLALTGNHIGDSGSWNSGGSDLLVTADNASIVNVPGFSGSTTTDLESFISGNNDLSGASGNPTVTVVQNGTSSFTGDSCTVLAMNHGRRERTAELRTASVSAGGASPAARAFAARLSSAMPSFDVRGAVAARAGDAAVAVRAIAAAALDTAQAVVVDVRARVDALLEYRHTVVAALQNAWSGASDTVRMLAKAARTQLVATLEASGETTNPVLGTVPAGKTVYAIFDVTVDAGARQQYTNTATVTGSNFSLVTTNTVLTHGIAPTKLKITAVNGGVNPKAGEAFAVVVQAQQYDDAPGNVAAATPVILSRHVGTGTLGGTLTGTILNGTSEISISGITYTKAESGVILKAAQNGGAGDVLADGFSAAFTVDPGALAQYLITGSANFIAGAASRLTLRPVDSNGNTTAGSSAVTISGRNTADTAANTHVLVDGDRNGTFNDAIVNASAAAPVTFDIKNATVESFKVKASSTPGPITGLSSTFTTYALASPGQVLITEFRLRGPNGVNDEYITFYNNTDATVLVGTMEGTGGWALVGANAVTRFAIPEGTLLPARSYYLATNNHSGDGFSLGAYPAGTGTVGAGDIQYDTEIPSETDGVGSGLALFRSASVLNLGNRLDAVGYTTVDALYREGAGLPIGFGELGGDNLEHAFTRSLTTGLPKDTDVNTDDFRPLDTSGAELATGQLLGAPGPRSSASPLRKTTVAVTPAPTAPLAVPANGTVRDNHAYAWTPAGGTTVNFPLGVLHMPKKFTNNTGQAITRLRIRIVDITTYPPAVGAADLRPIDATGTVVNTAGQAYTVSGGFKVGLVELPLIQDTMGGGMNTTITIDLSGLPGGSLAPGASVNVHLEAGVAQAGSFRIFYVVEGLP